MTPEIRAAYRYLDGDRRMQAHPLPDRTEPRDCAWLDVLGVAGAIVLLIVVAVLASVVPDVPR